MKASDIFLCSVVLWASLERGYGGRLPRSLGVEGAGSNLTQRHQDVIQSEGLQHFTTTQRAASDQTTRQEVTSSFIRDVPAIPEDINVQRLKNDDHLHEKYDSKITVDHDNSDSRSSNNKNRSLISIKSGVNSYKFNQSEVPSLQRSDLKSIHSSNEPSLHTETRDKAAGKDDKTNHNEWSIVSSTETIKLDPDWKSLEVKKKEKGKKEILDTVTVPTDYNAAGRIEKPFKDNAFSIKLKEKAKDLYSEASDDRRSTTIRISTSSSSSSSFSVNQHDNNNPRNSVSFPKVDSSSTSSNEVVNQSVISVINSNGVNSDTSKKHRVKYSVKRTQDVANDTDADNSSSNSNLLNEDNVSDPVSDVNLESKPSRSNLQLSTTVVEEVFGEERKTPFQGNKPTQSTPTKIDIPEKAINPSSTTLVKPSIAFKQHLAKLKGFEPVPTVPVNVHGEDLDENQDKSNGKTSTKPSLRKKSKPEYHTSTSEINIPPTATAWTLVSMRSPSDSLTTARLPVPSLGDTSSTTDGLQTRMSPKQTTTASLSRVKGFVPWSTRLLKTTTSRTSPPEETTHDSTPQMSKIDSDSSRFGDEQQQSDVIKSAEKSSPSSATETQSVIRTTVELERNMTETSLNTIPSSLNDVMVKDQSTTTSQISSTTESGIMVKEAIASTSSTKPELDGKTADKDNVIEAKISEETSFVDKSKGKPQEKPDETIKKIGKNTTVNEVLSIDISQAVNEIKPGNSDQILNLTKSTTNPTLEVVDSPKAKGLSEVIEMDPASGDILVDGAGDEGKSGEESEEDEKPKQTTTIPPNAEPVETTVMPDLDEDEGENDKEDDELSVVVETNKSAANDSKPSETIVDAEIKSTTPTLIGTEMNVTGTYVTSFDIISKDNSTQIVNKTPSQGDKNWYVVDPSPAMNSSSEEETSPKSVPNEVTTTATIETTIEPETTDTIKQETTPPPESTKSVMTVSSTASPTVTTTTELTTPEYNQGPEDTDESSTCVRIRVDCQDSQQLREHLASQFMNENISWEQVQIIGKELDDCDSKDLQEEDDLFGGRLEVVACFFDKEGKPSETIRSEFLRLHSKRFSDIVEVQNTSQPPMMDNGFDNVLAAIVLSVIAAICLVLLGILLVIVRKRQGKFNYGQRCTPVSLDDYSLDNISVYNSVRRKGALRASKRSYGNPAFDDPVGPSHPVNFAGLANCSSDREALDEEFSQIPMITVKPDELPAGAESKNRYANVIPLPETRVLLPVKEGSDSLKDYINANFIKGLKGQEKLYIACQAPLQSTIEDFWKMVWHQQTKVILMLTSLNENGVEKCADYLPQLEVTDCHRRFGDFQVTLKKHEVREKYIISNLQLKNLETNLWREVTHLWYSSWPSQGVPDDGSAMIAFLIEARSYMRGAQGPTVVHCSPGTGRTGTVIAIDLCIRDFETLRTVDIPKTVYALRRDRAGAVQTKDQYAFIYQVLNLYATKLTGGALDSI